MAPLGLSHRSENHNYGTSKITQKFIDNRTLVSYPYDDQTLSEENVYYGG
jgi:hypothetical protein